MIPPNNTELEVILSKHTQSPCKILQQEKLSGGNVHQALLLKTTEGPFFMKWDVAKKAKYFKAEVEGLNSIKSTGALPVPEIIHQGESEHNAFLLLEYIQNTEPARHYWVNFGKHLAKQHQNQAELYGAEKNNFIGQMPQSNCQSNDWLTFFGEERLERPISRAVRKGLLPRSTQRRFLKLFDKLDQLIPKEPPSLLHGDLWNGNVLTSTEGLAVVIDPAVYYGHREMDIAFSHLFGRFPTSFYRAYNKVWPLQDGWEERVHLHNIYPLLVHLNLFGERYLGQLRQALIYYV